MSTLLQNLRYAARLMASKPGFSLAAVLVLALGIGANTAMFSLVNAFLLKPQVIDRPEEIYGCYSRDANKGDDYRAFSYREYAALREKGDIFAGLLAHNLSMVGVAEGDTTRRTFADTVSSNFFSTLGVAMFRGRAFTLDEERPGSGIPVVILSHSYHRKTGTDLNQSLRINGKLFTVVGIAGEGFTGTTALISPSLFLPMGMFDLVNNEYEGRNRPLAAADNHSLFLAGRLRPGLTQDAADAQLAVIASRFEKAYPADKPQTFLVRPLSRLSVSTAPSSDGKLGVVALLLLSMAAIVLLIASLNVANMMLARGAARRKEIALRLALGAGRRTILQQLFTEGLLLAALGGAGGIVIASWSTRLLLRSLERMAPLEIVYSSGPDIRVLAATALFCLLSTVLFGLMPAWSLTRTGVLADLKGGGAELTGGKPGRLFSRRNLMVMGQLALSLVLLTAAGLFVRSATRASAVEPGFRMDRSVLVEMDASLAGYDETRGRAAYARVLDRVRALPGVEAAGLAATVPFGMVSLGRTVFPSAAAEKDAGVGCRFNTVTADYFQAIGLPLLRGRGFTPAESQPGQTPRVVILDKLAAERLWPGQEPLGRIVRLNERGPAAEVVGIVASMQENIVGHRQEPHVFVPFGQEYQTNVHLHLRVASEPPVLESVRGAIAGVDPQLPVLNVRSMRDHLDASMDVWIVRTAARMFSLFGAVALLLASVGSYGVRSYMVARRTREIGIRMAIGAGAGDALRLILNEGLKLAGVGLGLGLLLSFGLGRALAGMLYEVSGADPLVFTAAPLLLAAASLVACYLPARRAARVDPMVALRYE